MAHACENCKLRAHYDKNPKSLLGRFWRWHINFCPGWNAYFNSQDEERKAELGKSTSLRNERIRRMIPKQIKRVTGLSNK